MLAAPETARKPDTLVYSQCCPSRIPSLYISWHWMYLPTSSQHLDVCHITAVMCWIQMLPRGWWYVRCRSKYTVSGLSLTSQQSFQTGGYIVCSYAGITISDWIHKSKTLLETVHIIIRHLMPNVPNQRLYVINTACTFDILVDVMRSALMDFIIMSMATTLGHSMG